jgi:hypothetical protein
VKVLVAPGIFSLRALRRCEKCFPGLLNWPPKGAFFVSVTTDGRNLAGTVERFSVLSVYDD